MAHSVGIHFSECELAIDVDGIDLLRCQAQVLIEETDEGHRVSEIRFHGPGQNVTQHEPFTWMHRLSLLLRSQDPQALFTAGALLVTLGKVTEMRAISHEPTQHGPDDILIETAPGGILLELEMVTLLHLLGDFQLRHLVACEDLEPATN